MLKMKFRYLFTLLLFCLIKCAQAADIDKAAAQKAYENWCTAIGKAKGNASTMTKFYAPSAVLLATFSSQILTNRNGGLDSYFAKLTNNPDIQCKPEKLMTQVYNTVAVNTGFYNFT